MCGYDPEEQWNVGTARFPTSLEPFHAVQTLGPYQRSTSKG